MVGDGRVKRVLVVSDDNGMLNGYEALVRGCGCDATLILYNGPATEISAGRFDYAILGDMNGVWESVADKINVEHVVVVSEDPCVVEKANDKGLQGIYNKDATISKLLEILK